MTFSSTTIGGDHLTGGRIEHVDELTMGSKLLFFLVPIRLRLIKMGISAALSNTFYER